MTPPLTAAAARTIKAAPHIADLLDSPGAPLLTAFPEHWQRVADLVGRLTADLEQTRGNVARLGAQLTGTTQALADARRAAAAWTPAAAPAGSPTPSALAALQLARRRNPARLYIGDVDPETAYELHQRGLAQIHQGERGWTGDAYAQVTRDGWAHPDTEAPACACADGGPGTYEGPMRSCPVHGEVPS